MAPVKLTDETAVVHKANPAIAIRPTAGKLTIVSRRIYNLLLYHAQKQGIDREEYSLPLAQVVSQISSSENNASIKARLREMASTTIEWNSNPTGLPEDQDWNVASLLAAKISPARAGRPITLTWSYAPGVRRELIQPKQYTRLLLQISTRLSLYSAAVLLEIGFQYLTSPGQLTMRESVDWWAAVLKGQPLKKPVDYRFFKRDTLVPGIREVNESQDEFELELIERKDGRKIIELQFRIHRRRAALPAADEGKPQVSQPIDLELYEQLQTLGFKETDADILLSTEDAQRVRAALNYTRARIDKVESPAAYLRNVLAKGYADQVVQNSGPSDPNRASARQEMPSATAQAVADRVALDSLRGSYERSLIEAARQTHTTLAETARSELHEKFGATLTSPRDQQSWSRNGIKSTPLSARFFRWIASQDPSWGLADEQLQAWGEQAGDRERQQA